MVPVQQPIAGQRWMLVADEHVAPLAPELSQEMPSFVWMMNITDEMRPIPVGSFQVPELVGQRNKLMTGCHQPVETITGTEVAAAWLRRNVDQLCRLGGRRRRVRPEPEHGPDSV